MSRTMFDEASPGLAASDGSAADCLSLNSSVDERHAQRGNATALERYLLKRLFAFAGNPPIGIVLWDGTRSAPVDQTPLAWLTVADRATLWKLALDSLWEFGQAYADGRLDVAGNLEESLAVLYRLLNERRSGRRLSRALSAWIRRPRSNTLTGSRHNIHHHYDLGNDFYRLWLDEQLVYTCAYFRDRQMTLDDAQVAKLDLVCRKLRLQPGETVVEAGCGWGALALHMARHYGVRVTAFNISHEQIAFARERARREGLDGQVEFVEDDWRTMKQPCEVFVSVGMLEHVGLRYYEELGNVIDRCLPPEGRGLLHTIGQNVPRPMNPWIERHIFPGAYPPTLRQIMDIFEPHAFSVLDVENLRLHYALTLRHWLDRFEQISSKVAEQFGESFVRMWRLYLAGSLAAFDSGSLQLFQIVFSRETNNNIPWTRAALCGRES